MPSIAGRVLRGTCWPSCSTWPCPCFSALHRGQGPAGRQQDHLHHPGTGVSVPSIAGRVLRGWSKFRPQVTTEEMFQCPPSRAGSCG